MEKPNKNMSDAELSEQVIVLRDLVAKLEHEKKKSENAVVLLQELIQMAKKVFNEYGEYIKRREKR